MAPSCLHTCMAPPNSGAQSPDLNFHCPLTQGRSPICLCSSSLSLLPQNCQKFTAKRGLNPWEHAWSKFSASSAHTSGYLRSGNCSEPSSLKHILLHARPRHLRASTTEHPTLGMGIAACSPASSPSLHQLAESSLCIFACQPLSSVCRLLWNKKTNKQKNWVHTAF